jgi:hypothetical protein
MDVVLIRNTQYAILSVEGRGKNEERERIKEQCPRKQSEGYESRKEDRKER